MIALIALIQVATLYRQYASNCLPTFAHPFFPSCRRQD